MLIISDIAGQFDALQRLVARVPEDMPIVLLGDLVDRGAYSAEVVDWAMNTPRVRAVMGNHEHMMLDFYLNEENYGSIYAYDIWLANGGSATRSSYSRKYGSIRPPVEHLDWLKNLPLYILEDGLLMSHAPLNAHHTLEEMVEITKREPLYGKWTGQDGSLLWNRSLPKKRDEFYQIFGHNSGWGVSFGPGWMCTDQSSASILTGVIWRGSDEPIEVLEEHYLKKEAYISSSARPILEDVYV